MLTHQESKTSGQNNEGVGGEVRALESISQEL